MNNTSNINYFFSLQTIQCTGSRDWRIWKKFLQALSFCPRPSAFPVNRMTFHQALGYNFCQNPFRSSKRSAAPDLVTDHNEFHRRALNRTIHNNIHIYTVYTHKYIGKYVGMYISTYIQTYFYK